MGRPTRIMFSSHDGFGLGHVRRNSSIARAVLAHEPDAEVVLVTGVAVRPKWLAVDRMRIVSVPPLLKGSDGSYRNADMRFEEAVERRATTFQRAVETFRPDVVVVDRHPYGTAGELRPGLDTARRQGAATILGLRDILDEPGPVRAELAGAGWAGVRGAFDAILVYGSPIVCDHVAEYGLPITPTYCGWVVEQPAPARPEAGLVVVTAGGGGDGRAVFELGLGLSELMPDRHTVLVAGPYAGECPIPPRPGRRLTMLRDVAGCGDLFARADAVVQMAGYNSTVEALAAGLRPVLVPRRSPRREQAIRASRLAALGLADVVDEGAPPAEVAWLLTRPRHLASQQLRDAGIELDGAAVAAAALRELARVAA